MAYSVPLITPRNGGGHEQNYPSLMSAPGPFVSNGDFLEINVTTSDSSGSLELTYRLLLPNGEVVNGAQPMVFSGTGVQTAVRIALSTGWLIGFDLHRLTGTLTDGEVIASVHVVQANGSGYTPMLCLASGEVTNIRSLGLGAFTYSTPAPTVVTVAPSVVALADPAPGAQWTATVPAATQWQVLSIYFEVAMSAAVPTRNLAIQAHIGASRVMLVFIDKGFIANDSAALTAAPGLVYRSDVLLGFGGVSSFGISPLQLPAGATISSDADNFDVADQWSNIALNVIAKAA